MENEANVFGDTQSMAATVVGEHDTQRLSNLTDHDAGVVHGLDKIASSLDQLRLEIQSVRVLLEALVKKL